MIWGVPLFWKHPLLILLHFVFSISSECGNLPMDSYLKKWYFPRFCRLPFFPFSTNTKKTPKIQTSFWGPNCILCAGSLSCCFFSLTYLSLWLRLVGLGLGWWFGIRIGVHPRIPIPFIFGGSFRNPNHPTPKPTSLNNKVPGTKLSVPFSGRYVFF